VGFIVLYTTTAHARSNNKSPLPLTDPYDAVSRTHSAVHRCRRSV